MLRLDSTVRRIDGLLETEIDGEVALMSVEMGNYFSLNGTGSLIWKHIGSDISIDQLVKEVTAVYEIDQDECANEVINLLEELNNLGLLQVR